MTRESQTLCSVSFVLASKFLTGLLHFIWLLFLLFFLQKLRLTGSVVEAEFNLKIIKLPSFWNVCDSDLDFAV